MKSYIKNNKYLITNQVANQFGGAMMGIMLSASVGMRGSNTLILATSLFSITFYMILQYTAMWDAGGKDIIKVEGRRLEYKPYAGFVMSLLAAIPNFVIALMVVIGAVFGSNTGFDFAWADSIYTAGRFAGLFWESMYNGLIQLYSPNNPIAFVLIPLPAMLIAGLGYYAGLKNFRIIRIKKKKGAGKKKH